MKNKRNNWKLALYIAAAVAYESEVLDTQMEQLMIGEGLEFASREDWIEQRVDEWLELAND
jgi:hypothetical protein